MVGVLGLLDVIYENVDVFLRGLLIVCGSEGVVLFVLWWLLVVGVVIVDVNVVEEIFVFELRLLRVGLFMLCFDIF